MTTNDTKIPLWRDERFWRIAIQLLVVIALIVGALLLLSNLNRNMQRQGIQFGFSFLRSPAGFSIGETLLPYLPNDPYFRALLAGVVNTLRVMIPGIILTTLLGIAAGIASFSENWLVRKLSLSYVEIVRNTPMLLQLYFWYFAVFFGLPRPENQINIVDAFFLSKAGVYIPWPANTPLVWMWLAVLVAGAVAAFFLWQWRTKLIVEQGASGKLQLQILLGMAIAAALILVAGLGWRAPISEAPGQVQGGLRLTLEFSALLAGLVFYTGAFVAEVVRAGIQAVSKGQWEAARSLGLQPGLVMRLVVFPQALRVMLPPLNSQYQNLAKNSSLGSALAYPEIFLVSSTTFNQTGRPVEVFVLIMVIYLIINLTISLSMNQLNRVVQLKER
ncbi:ABC transporter permease subunit [Oscillatoria sp. FACHB-1407]|uniref:amino acid ABC transporter permease n=1 Tax=Oscillatoria sp. FACHB-1407 TaxID=2692847 RepID=UPI0016871887|nr:ABC transporter permease subunit [Oscillatoria sp. FACHB-1407]MBD2463278.1 ABC transporter permease subunit [Oscillatoria sp. FACHB-1407]